MYVTQVHIEKFRILENIEFVFRPPPGNGGNVVNVVAGVNGCGKTSLLEGIVEVFSSNGKLRDKISVIVDPETQAKFGTFIAVANWSGIAHNLIPSMIQKDAQYEPPRVIFVQAHLDFDYKPVNGISVDYRLVNRIATNTLLGNAEFYIREYVLAQERESRESDPKKRAKDAVADFNCHFEGTDLLTRLDDLDPRQFNRPIFRNIRSDRVTIDHLSDGEKQLYGRVVALMILDPRDSVILIDEPEISLHPNWQRVIMDIYARIGVNNQFIVATHSPHIIANTLYQNLTLLTKEKGASCIQVVNPAHPPSGVDVNSILREVMGTQPIPDERLELYRSYRKLVEEGREESDQGLQLEQKILDRESQTSQFMQEMQFLKDLREGA